MSSYNYRKYREPFLPDALRRAANACRLDRVECAIVHVLHLSADELQSMATGGGIPPLCVRRLYDDAAQVLPIPEEWVPVASKAGLVSEEVRLALAMGLSPKRVLGMISSESWKDAPALHLRRMYDERHVHPALVRYWEEIEGPMASPYTKSYRAFLSRRKKSRKT